MLVLRVKDWNAHFENNRTRELKFLEWVPVPNKMDGDGYTELVDHPEGAAHLGAWLAIIEIASRCDPRGTLLRDSARPHDAASLARMSRLPGAIFGAVIPRLLAIGWLEQVELPANAESDASAVGKGVLTPAESNVVTIPQEGATIQQAPAEKRLRNGMERKGIEIHPAAQGSAEPLRDSTPAASFDGGGPIAEGQESPGEGRPSADPTRPKFPTYPCAGSAKAWELPDPSIEEWKPLFPGVDVRLECKRAHAWIAANPGRRKTAKGMPRFLLSWLGRCQDRGGRSPTQIDQGADASGQGESQLDKLLRKKGYAV